MLYICTLIYRFLYAILSGVKNRICSFLTFTQYHTLTHYVLSWERCCVNSHFYLIAAFGYGYPVVIYAIYQRKESEFICTQREILLPSYIQLWKTVWLSECIKFLNLYHVLCVLSKICSDFLQLYQRFHTVNIHGSIAFGFIWIISKYFLCLEPSNGNSWKYWLVLLTNNSEWKIRIGNSREYFGLHIRI